MIPSGSTVADFSVLDAQNDIFLVLAARLVDVIIPQVDTPLKTKTETIIWYHMIMYSIDNVPDQVWKLPCVLCCAPRLYPRYPCYLSHRYFDFHWLRRWPINSSWLPRLPVFFPVCYNPCICEIQGSQRKCRAGVQLGISWDITPAYPYIPLQHLAV